MALKIDIFQFRITLGLFVTLCQESTTERYKRDNYCFVSYRTLRLVSSKSFGNSFISTPVRLMRTFSYFACIDQLSEQLAFVHSCNLDSNSCVCTQSSLRFVLVSADCWSDWSNWSQCTKVCGCGRQFRVRFCKCAYGQGHAQCPGFGESSQSCNCNACPNGPPF